MFEAGLILQGMKVLFGGALVVLPVSGASSSDFRFNWYSILLSYFVGHMIRNWEKSIRSIIFDVG